MSQPLDDFALTVGGLTFAIRRTHRLAMRIEAKFGPLHLLQQRLATNALTIVDLANLYHLAVQEQKGEAPDVPELQEWVFDVGVPHAASQILPLMLELFVGNERLVELYAERGVATQNPPAAA